MIPMRHDPLASGRLCVPPGAGPPQPVPRSQSATPVTSSSGSSSLRRSAGHLQRHSSQTVGEDAVWETGSWRDMTTLNDLARNENPSLPLVPEPLIMTRGGAAPLPPFPSTPHGTAEAHQTIPTSEQSCGECSHPQGLGSRGNLCYPPSSGGAGRRPTEPRRQARE